MCKFTFALEVLVQGMSKQVYYSLFMSEFEAKMSCHHLHVAVTTRIKVTAHAAVCKELGSIVLRNNSENVWWKMLYTLKGL